MDCFALGNNMEAHTRTRKKQKTTHYSAEVVVEIEDREGNTVPIRALLDTGTSASMRSSQNNSSLRREEPAPIRASAPPGIL